MKKEMNGGSAKYDNRDDVEYLDQREDGKTICEQLKQMRIAVARANNISYTPANCNSKGLCAGTCEQCDKELRYLNEQLAKIPKELRVIPAIDLRYERSMRQAGEYVREREEFYPHRLILGVLPRTVKKTKLVVPKSIKRRNNLSKGDKHE